jgi:hypothetical protein
MLPVQHRRLRNARTHAQIVASYIRRDSASEARSPDADALAIHARLILQPVDCAAKVLDFIHRVESVARNSVAAAKMAIVDRQRHISCLGQLLALFDEAGSRHGETMANDEGRIRRAFGEGGRPVQVGLAANAVRKEMDRFRATHIWMASIRYDES